MQLTTEHAEKHIDSKRKTIIFYDFLCALFYMRFNLIISKKITREQGELLEIKSLFKAQNTSMNSVVLFKCIFWVNKDIGQESKDG
jgi:membrane-anchored glycerophosphoryl diester phosphodiesterase (GDPDase)